MAVNKGLSLVTGGLEVDIAANIDITTVSPSIADASYFFTGGTLIVSGLNFGSIQGTGVAVLNGDYDNPLVVLNWSDMEIEFDLPTNFYVAAAYSLTITSDAGEERTLENALTIEEQMRIEGVMPAGLALNDITTEITITGTMFLADQGVDGEVDVSPDAGDNWYSCTVVSWSDNSIVVTLPEELPVGNLAFRVIRSFDGISVTLIDCFYIYLTSGGGSGISRGRLVNA
jgi:hypothetical protein